MKKIRYSLAAIALVATLCGSFILGIGLASMASAAASRYTSSSFVVGHSAKPVASLHKPPCPWAGSDC